MGNKILKNTIRIRIGKEKNGEHVFKAILSHPMETGYRRDHRTGGKVPADYIEDVKITVDGEKYIEMVLGKSVSKNPYLSFTFAEPPVENQLMKISWVDNHNIETSYDIVLKFGQGDTFKFTGDNKGSEYSLLTTQTGPVCKTKTPVVAH